MLATMTIAEGLMDVEAFLAFLSGAANDPFAGMTLGGVFVAAILGGLAMNLTPCVLPMVPINLIIIGKSARRGALYGLGIALAYGTMGLLAAFGGLAFGSIQGSPWFNLTIAVLFVVLSLSLFGVFSIDLSGARVRFKPGARPSASLRQDFFALFMGAVSAVLAGACVAPILIAVLLLTAKLSAQGNWFALALPFALGLGMALPWLFAGAGLQVLPKPGAWMKRVEKGFGVLVLLFAAWYGFLAYQGWTARTHAPERDRSGALEATPATFPDVLAGAKRPVLVDCWATWCKNCRAMERKTLRDERVQKALERFTVIRLQAENIEELLAIPGFEKVQGLPAFAIVE